MSEATHAVTGDSHKEAAKDTNQPSDTNTVSDVGTDKANEKSNEAETPKWSLYEQITVCSTEENIDTNISKTKKNYIVVRLFYFSIYYSQY